MKRSIFWHNAGILALLSAGILLLSIFSERIVDCNGFGYDGETYADMALRFQDFLNGTLPPPGNNTFYRFLPSVLCHYTLRILGFGLTGPHVIIFFQVYNGLILLGTGVIWTRICEALAMNASGRWWGFLGFFGNYAVLKYGFYYPVLMDVSGLFFGTALLWAYLRRRVVVGLFLTGTSFFVWPPATLLGGLLTLLPRPDVPASGPTPVRESGPWAALGVVAVLFAPRLLAAPPLSTSPEFRAALPLGVAFAAFYLFHAFRGLLPGLAGSLLEAARRRDFWLRAGTAGALAGAAMLLPVLSSRFMALDWIGLLVRYLYDLITLSYHRPAEFALTMILYYGPILAFVIFVRPAFMACCREMGPGYVLVLLFVLLQSLNPLSRQMIAGIPFVLAPLAMVLGRKRFPVGTMIFFTAASLVVSKVWLLNNAGLEPSQVTASNPVYWRRYLSSTGWWMPDDLYLLQGTLVFVGLLVLAVYWRTLHGNVNVAAEDVAGNVGSGY